MAKKYKFVSWNVNGVRAVDKKAALKWIDEDEVDILGLQEIKATQEQIPATIFEKEYPNLHVSTSAIKGRSGVALFSNIKWDKEDNCQSVDILDEGRINEVHFRLGDKEIVFFNVYFPNGQKDDDRLQYKMQFYDRFLEHCEQLKQSGKSLIICGDVNTAHTPIDLARPKPNENTSGFLQIERDWVTKFLEHGYVDTFREVHGDAPDNYSWWSYRANARANNVGWRIDYFFVSEDLKEHIINASILSDIFGSDHCPVTLEMEF
jgi:exodeoxyribonuclease-3